MLDLIYFPPPHTGHEIGALVKKVFQEWDIKVPIIVTDNGSNMVKAFKQVRANHVKDVIESVVANTISTEINAEADAVHEDNLSAQILRLMVKSTSASGSRRDTYIFNFTSQYCRRCNNFGYF